MEVYSHSTGYSVTGGVVYRGSELQGHSGEYFYGDWGTGLLRSVRVVDGRVVARTDWTALVGTVPRVVAFGTDADGELLLVTTSGTIWRLAGPTSPVGFVDEVTTSSGRATITGWTYDPTIPSTSIPIHTYVNGTHVAITTANLPRTDVNQVFNITGNHGYHVTVDARPGDQVCLYAINDGTLNSGPNTRLGCATIPG